jgi:hypothetical protein
LCAGVTRAREQWIGAAPIIIQRAHRRPSLRREEEEPPVTQRRPLPRHGAEKAVSGGGRQLDVLAVQTFPAPQAAGGALAAGALQQPRPPPGRPRHPPLSGTMSEAQDEEQAQGQVSQG